MTSRPQTPDPKAPGSDPPADIADDRPTAESNGFIGSVNVLTESGWLEISKVVRKRLPVRLACADPDTGRIDLRPITSWSCRLGDVHDLVLLETFARGGQRRERGAHRAIRVARGQPIATPGGLRRAGDLRPGDRVYTIGTRLEAWQEQVVIGSLLGDGYSAGRAVDHYGGLAICHGESQRDYLDWKFALLANVGAKPPSIQKLGAGGFAKRPTSRSTTRMHPRSSTGPGRSGPQWGSSPAPAGPASASGSTTAAASSTTPSGK